VANKKTKKKNGRAADSQSPADEQGRISVLVEIKSPSGASRALEATALRQMNLPEIEVDEEYEPIPLTNTDSSSGASIPTFLVRAFVKREEDIAVLEAHPEVVRVWRDTPIAPFTRSN
jgi:serine protease AprX